MRFFARLDQRSAIHRQWVGSNRVSAHLDGVLFRWNNGKRLYECGELTAEQVDGFRARQDQCVILETVGDLPKTKNVDLVEDVLVGNPVKPAEAPVDQKPKSKSVPKSGSQRLRLTE